MKRFLKFIWILIKEFFGACWPGMFCISLIVGWVMLILWGDEYRFSQSTPLFIKVMAGYGIATLTIIIMGLIFFALSKPIEKSANAIRRAWIKSKD